MLFLIFNNADIQFAEKKLTWRTYTTKKTLPATRQVKFIDQKEVAKMALNENIKAFIVHVSSLGLRNTIHQARKAQMALLLAKVVTVLAKYLDFADVFLKESSNILPKQIKVNEHVIELENGKQLPYKPIYSLKPVKLKTFKTYIKTNLANGFIRTSKLPENALILFIRKQNNSFLLSVDYWGLNNLTIKNQYPLSLIGESLNWLDQAKQFTQLDFISAYPQMKIKEGNNWKTVFWTWYGHFKYQVMPFRLSNVPASFQGYINKILAEKLDIFVIVYLDDIFIYTKDPGQAHINAVWRVFEKLRKHDLFANFKKCRFHIYKVGFLGYVVSAQGVQIEDERIKEVKNWYESKSVHNIQVFSVLPISINVLSRASVK